MSKGGVRQGTPGAQYPNRSDLTKPLPITASPGGAYGDRIASVRSQQAIPMAPAPQAPGGGGGPVPPNAPPAVAPSPGPPPTPLDAPTQRPNEPVTAGLPIGPGPGPEALGANMVPNPQTLGELLDRLAQQNPDLATLASWSQSGRR